MSSRLSQILLLVGAIIAFLPVLGVDYFLDHFVRSEAGNRLQESVNSITYENQIAVNSAISAMRQIVKESPSLCTPTFIKNAQKQILANKQLAQIIVENKDKVQYCDGFNSETKYLLISKELPIIDGNETISIVRLLNSDSLMMRISKQLAGNKYISAFVHINSEIPPALSTRIVENSYIHIGLSDGTKILSKGNEILDSRLNDKKSNIVVSSIANSIPIEVIMVAPFSAVRADFSSLYTMLTIAAIILGIGFLLAIFYFIRSINLPTIDIERAIERGEFKPHYQPIMNLKTGKIVGCEVLVRWVKKDGTVLSPGFFIDLAESSGLAVPMTIKLMEQVKKDLDELSKTYPSLKIGINLFEGHFRDSSFVEEVKAVFSNSNILMSQLVFEITERRPLTDQKTVDTVVSGLQALGCRLALDDAGTGHSNLAYMQRLGVDIIKIDRVFVNMIGSNDENVPILDGLISMAFDLNADIVAEGVETEQQALYLRAHGVVQAQGFLFAPALQKESYIKLVKKINSTNEADDEASSHGAGNKVGAINRAA